jgi:hypothetical protein
MRNNNRQFAGLKKRRILKWQMCKLGVVCPMYIVHSAYINLSLNLERKKKFCNFGKIKTHKNGGFWETIY